MNSIQIAEKVLENGCQLARRRKQDSVDSDGKIIPMYDVKDAFTGKKKGWFYVDSFTASAIMACFNSLNDENKRKAPRLPITTWAEFALNNVK